MDVTNATDLPDHFVENLALWVFDKTDVIPARHFYDHGGFSIRGIQRISSQKNSHKVPWIGDKPIPPALVKATNKNLPTLYGVRFVRGDRTDARYLGNLSIRPRGMNERPGYITVFIGPVSEFGDGPADDHFDVTRLFRIVIGLGAELVVFGSDPLKGELGMVRQKVATYFMKDPEALVRKWNAADSKD